MMSIIIKLKKQVWVSRSLFCNRFWVILSSFSVSGTSVRGVPAPVSITHYMFPITKYVVKREIEAPCVLDRPLNNLAIDFFFLLINSRASHIILKAQQHLQWNPTKACIPSHPIPSHMYTNHIKWLPNYFYQDTTHIAQAEPASNKWSNLM